MANQQRAINAMERQRNALELRMAGVSYADIAKTLGYRDHSGAVRAVAAALKKTLQEPADKLRQLEVERLDKMLFGLWSKAKGGNEYAIDRVLKIQERRARLLGLDAPTKQDITSKGEQVSVILYLPDNGRDNGNGNG